MADDVPPKPPGPGEPPPPPPPEPPSPPAEEAGLTMAERHLAVRAGLFIVLFFLLGVAIAVILGSRGRFVRSRVTLRADFTDVQGLKTGAAVWLSGVQVGQVTRISFSMVGGRPMVRVDLEIGRRALAWMGADSVARIGSQGLLGDRIVEITIASPGAPPLKPGASLQTVSPPNLNQLLEEAARAVENAARVADLAATAMESFASPRTVADAQQIVTIARRLLRQAERGPGVVHGLLYDPRQAEQVARIIGDLARLSGDLDASVRRFDQMLAGTDQEGRQLVNNLSRAARGVADTAEALQRAGAVPELGLVVRDLADIIGWVRAGQGTLGALIVDPTVYEQLVSVLGGVGRSRVLRALVRFGLSREAGKSAGQRLPSSGIPPSGVPPPGVPARSPGGQVPPSIPPAGARLPPGQ